MRTLDEIMLATGTDKNSEGHAYAKIYGELFQPWRDEPVTLVEMGVWEGASLRAWAKYFTHSRARIFGLDNDITRFPPMVDTRVMAIACQVDDEPAMRSMAAGVGAVDLVIDDASHQTAQQQTSFAVLWPRVAPGGLYVIEDLHTLFWTRANPPGSTAWLHEWVDSVLGLGLEPRDNDCECSEIRFYNSMVVFRKRA